MPDLLLMILLLLAVGAFAGVISGLLGVGGGLVLVPAFYFIFAHMGYDSAWLMQICLATSLATIVGTSLRSVRLHHARGAVDGAVLRAWAPAIVIGAVIGVLTAAQLRSATLQLIFGVLGVAASLYMALGRSHWRLGEAMPGGVARWSLGSALGFLSVLMGIGGGTFGVPLMTLHGMPIHRAVGTASGLGIIIALPSVVAFLFLQIPAGARPPYTLGAVNLPAFALITAMTMLTTPLGVRLAHALDPKPLKRVFAIFIMFVALNMLRKAAGY